MTVRQCIHDGDALLAAGDAVGALQKFREAAESGCTDPTLFEKLIATHQAVTTEWTQEDLALSLSWEMRRQELCSPGARAARERLAPEWQEVTERLRRVLVATDQEIIAQLCEDIAAYESKAVRPLLDFLLLLKTATLPTDNATPEDA